MATEDTPPESDVDAAGVLYQARVNAWFTTRLEFDKTLLGLSTFGLGLWRFMLQAVGHAPTWVRVCHGGMAMAFLATVVLVLWIFKHNSDVLEAAIQSDSDAMKRENLKAKRLDNAARFLFLLGIVLFVAVGCYAAWSQGPVR